MQNTKDKIYQIQIVLNDSKPKIWRRVLVPADILLPDLHKIIQTTMGWKNSHLHQFQKNQTLYSEKALADEYMNVDVVEYSEVKLSDLLQKEKDRIEYQYDFGDSWRHTIILEKVLQAEKGTKYPLCIDGKMNCPPEDCGGVWGYMNMLQILKDPNHPEYEMFLEWLGGDFEPEFFNKHIINELLHHKNYGCREEW